MPAFVYLASQSPRRSQLLAQIGIRHELLLPDADGAHAEDAEALEAVLPGESPTAYVQRVTHLKLDAAVARHARRGLAAAPILCADTTVARGRTIYGKPLDAMDAARMLAELSGHSHRVLTALALQVGEQRLSALSVSRVTFAAMGAAQIDAYVATGEPMGKAGGYAIQGQAERYVSRLCGSYSGVMGLPLQQTAALLQRHGLLAES